MMTEFGKTLARYWGSIQDTLFPIVEKEAGPLTDKHYQIIATLEISRAEQFIPYQGAHEVGRPLDSRRALVRSFVAKAVLNIPTTRQLIDRLQVDAALRRICGFGSRREIPSESTFSRAFAEFAQSELPSRVHEALILATQKDRIIGHISRDATEIEAREKPITKEQKPVSTPTKRGRPKKGEEPAPKEPTRLQKQQTMTLEELTKDLPKGCNVGTKRNSKGFQESWIGYKFHLDVADGGIPISAILTSASVHDSQVAIPLATITSRRVTNLYDLMDAAYDAPEIKATSRALGHVPIIDVNPRTAERKQEILEEQRRRQLINFTLPEDIRFNERSTVERTNASLKDDAGARFVRVRGHSKVMCHLMFGVLAVTANQILRLVT